MRNWLSRGRVFALCAVSLAAICLFALVVGIEQGRERARILKADAAALSRCAPSVASGRFRAAVTGPGTKEKDAAFCVVRAIAPVSVDGYTVGGHGRLEVKEGWRLEALAAMRPVLAEVVAGRIETVGSLYALDLPVAHAWARSDQMDAFLVWLSRDQVSYERVLRAQIAHTRTELDTYINDQGSLENIVSAESKTLGHLLEARAQSVIAQTGDTAKVSNNFRVLVADGISLVSLPGPRPNAYGDYDRLGAWLAERTEQIQGQALTSREPELFDEPAAADFINQSLVGSWVAHGTPPRESLTNQSFVADGRIRPLASLTEKQWEDLSAWLTNNTRLSSLGVITDSLLREAARETAGTFSNDQGQHAVSSL
ncbi:MAG: hypothetical protein JWN52_4453 [Actinomycetia bacterium]|nr:hypothetical protein [Actinomycetes bacterium]